MVDVIEIVLALVMVNLGKQQRTQDKELLKWQKLQFMAVKYLELIDIFFILRTEFISLTTSCPRK